MQHSPKRGIPPTKGSFARGTTQHQSNPPHTHTRTHTHSVLRPACNKRFAGVVDRGCDPKRAWRDGIGEGANGRLSAGCDWALWLVALNPSALSKAVPASSTSTPPCVPQYPAAKQHTEYRVRRTQRITRQHAFAASVSAGRGHVPGQARLPSHKPSLTTLPCWRLYRGLPISLRLCDRRTAARETRRDGTRRDKTGDSLSSGDPA